jgi:hypothetical protein
MRWSRGFPTHVRQNKVSEPQEVIPLVAKLLAAIKVARFVIALDGY